MVDHRTENSRYKSPSTGDYCTAAQYIAELICQRMAEKENAGSLAYKFWNTKKWRNIYTQQIILANRLVEQYDEMAIIKVLDSPQGKKIYSLRYPNLKSLILEQQSKIKKTDKTILPLKNIDVVSKPRKPFGKKSDLSKLKDLDDDR